MRSVTACASPRSLLSRAASAVAASLPTVQPNRIIAVPGILGARLSMIQSGCSSRGPFEFVAGIRHLEPHVSVPAFPQVTDSYPPVGLHRVDAGAGSPRTLPIGRDADGLSDMRTRVGETHPERGSGAKNLARQVFSQIVLYFA